MGNAVPQGLDLMGMPGREAMTQTLEQAAAQAREQGSALAVLAVDVDHFKDFSDCHAKSEAETALRQLAQVLKQSLPASASLAHLVGDEFVIILPATDLQAAASFAEELRARVEAAFAHGDADSRLTITLGVAASPAGKSWSTRSLLSLADARMTFAKKRLNPHHNLVWAGALPSNWYQRLDVDAATWPSLELSEAALSA